MENVTLLHYHDNLVENTAIQEALFQDSCDVPAVKGTGQAVRHLQLGTDTKMQFLPTSPCLPEVRLRSLQIFLHFASKFY